MNWVHLHEKGALPGDITFSMAQAADRAMRGSRLGPGARKSLRKFQKKLRDEQVMRQREDWDARDQQLRDGARTGLLLPGMARPTPAPSTSPRAPGGAGTAAPPRPTTVGGLVGSPGGGGVALRSSFDGRTASFQDLQARLAQLGISAPYMENHPSSQPLPRSPGLAVRIKEERARIDAAKRLAARSAEIERGKLDAKTADPEAVRRRLAQLGISHDIQNSIRPPPEPLKPLDRGPDPFQVAAEARRKAAAAAKRALAQARKGRPPDTRTMGDLVFAEYLKARKFAGGW